MGTEKPDWVSRSPYVYLEDGRPILDVARYLRDQGVSGRLDAALFELGINETFAANPDDPENLTKSVQATVDWADKLLAAFRAAEPGARLVDRLLTKGRSLGNEHFLLSFPRGARYLTPPGYAPRVRPHQTDAGAAPTSSRTRR